MTLQHGMTSRLNSCPPSVLRQGLGIIPPLFPPGDIAHHQTPCIRTSGAFESKPATGSDPASSQLRHEDNFGYGYDVTLILLAFLNFFLHCLRIRFRALFCSLVFGCTSHHLHHIEYIICFRSLRLKTTHITEYH